MAFPSYPQATDAVIGENDLVYENTWDVVNIAIQEAFAVGHDPSTGEHTAFFTSSIGGLLTTEIDTFTGDGLDNRTVALTNTNLQILFLRIWNSTQLYTIVRSASWTSDEGRPLTYSASIANTIQALGTGSFEVGSSDYVNKSGDTIYYTAYGIDMSSPTGNGNSFTPSWVQHNERIILNANSDGCSTRTSKEIKSRYLAEHTEAGAHNSSVYSGAAWIAIGSYVGDSTDPHTITVSPSFAIKSLWVFRLSAPSTYPCFKTANMPQTGTSDTKQTTSAALASDRIKSLGTGTFTVSDDNDVNLDAATYYYVAFGVQ